MKAEVLDLLRLRPDTGTVSLLLYSHRAVQLTKPAQIQREDKQTLHIKFNSYSNLIESSSERRLKNDLKKIISPLPHSVSDFWPVLNLAIYNLFSTHL